jgi:hypothetical protein
MRKFLITLAILAACAALLIALWISRGREISSFIDRYWTIETASTPIQSVAYEGSGSGGILVVNDFGLSLNEAISGVTLSMGSTKDNQLALATSGKVFAFGPLTSTAEDSGERLATAPPSGDQAFLSTRRSALSWPTPFEINLMTGQSPSWKRNTYQHIQWKKFGGANLKMVWRYEQFFYSGNGWTSGLMTREGSTGLIRVEIKE